MKKLLLNYPIVASIGYFLITMLLPWGILYPLLNQMPYYFGYATKYMITFALTLLITILVYKKVPFTLKCPSYFKGLVTFGLIGLICAFVAFFASMQGFDRQTNFLEVFSFILYIIAIVISEEILFRGLILGSILSKYDKDIKGVLFSITIASIIFGLRHYINLITTPNTIISTTGQVLFTFMAGFYLSAVYIRSSNPYIGCTIHFLEDAFTMCWLLFSTQYLANQNVDGELLNTTLLVLVHSIYVISGVLMLTKDKHYQYKSIMEN